MMKKTVLVIVAVLLAFQKQVLGATDQEVKDAYSELLGTINIIFQETAFMRNDLWNNLRQKMDLIKSDGELALKNKVEETNQLIQKMAARTVENIDVTGCIRDLSLQTYVDDALDRMDHCLYKLRYTTGHDMVYTRWFDLYRLGYNYLGCAQKAIKDCKGDETCNDQIIAEIAGNKKTAVSQMNLLTVNMNNIADSVPVNCKDRVLMDVYSFSSDYVEYVSACIEETIRRYIVPVCFEWTK